MGVLAPNGAAHVASAASIGQTVTPQPPILLNLLTRATAQNTHHTQHQDSVDCTRGTDANNTNSTVKRNSTKGTNSKHAALAQTFVQLLAKPDPQPKE